jgi:hypothetical protein
MNKQCKQCGIDFVPTNDNRGHEQLYCSKKCGQISARNRREERLKNANNGYTQQPTNQPNQSINMEQQPMGGTFSNGGNNTINDLSHLEKLYEAKIENNYLKIKCENLEEKIKALELEVNQLNMDIEAMELDEDMGNENNGILGGIFEQFKADPISTIAMVKMMFNNDKKESNEKATATKTAQQGKS